MVAQGKASETERSDHANQSWHWLVVRFVALSDTMRASGMLKLENSVISFSRPSCAPGNASDSPRQTRPADLTALRFGRLSERIERASCLQHGREVGAGSSRVVGTTRNTTAGS